MFTERDEMYFIGMRTIKERLLSYNRMASNKMVAPYKLEGRFFRYQELE